MTKNYSVHLLEIAVILTKNDYSFCNVYKVFCFWQYVLLAYCFFANKKTFRNDNFYQSRIKLFAGISDDFC